MKTSLMAGASRFAHFAGLAPRSSRRAAEDDDRRDDAEDDDKDPDASDDDDQDDADPKPEGKKARKAKKAKAEGDDDDKDASDDDGDDGKDAEDDDDGKNADDDDKDEEMKGKGAIAQARKREQARITHIVTHKAAASNPVLALSLACETRMTRKEAVAVLRSQPAGGGAAANRHARPDRQGRNANLGTDSEPLTGKAAVDASWGSAFAKAGVKPLR